MMRTSIVIGRLAPVALLLVWTGCANAPTEEIAAADAGLAKARAAEAAEFAPESFAAATQARQALDDELALQGGRMALVRSYGEARELAAAATAAAEQAERDAVAAREQARTESVALIAEARATLAEVQHLLETAPRGKGSRADLALLKSDVAGIESSLNEVDVALADGRYLESRTGAQSARDGATRVRDELARAIEAVAAAKRRPA